MSRTTLLLLVSVVGLPFSTFAQRFTYAPIDVHCDPDTDAAACPAGLAPGGTAAQTVLSGINAEGHIVGAYTDAAGRSHGFLLKEGRYRTIDVPGSVLGLEVVTLPTVANGINPQGDVVGYFIAPVNPTAAPDSAAYCPSPGSPACWKGFLYRRGKFSPLLAQGHPGSVPQRIEPDGNIYGCVHDLNLMDSMLGTTWFRLGAGGTASLSSLPMSMTNGATPGGGMAVGLFNEMLPAGGFGPRHGFVMNEDGLQQYDVERSGQPASTLTAIWDVNPGRAFVGVYVIAGRRHGFLQLPDSSAPLTPSAWASGSAIDIDYPGAASTIAYGINSDGVIVGQYNDRIVIGGKTVLGPAHGFVAFPEDTE